MSKSRHKYTKDDSYDDGVVEHKPTNNRHKEKRLDRALRTKNIDELMELENEQDDNEDYEPIWNIPVEDE